MKIGLPFLRVFLPAITLCFLSACSIVDDPVLNTMRHVSGFENRGKEDGLNPAFRYLRVVVDGRVVYLALGNVDHGIEVWYSAKHEVLRLLNGRLDGATGTETAEWRHVSMPEFPSWAALAASKKPYIWIRIRDVMPGYRYGIRDELLLHVVPAPKKSELTGLDAGKLTWFEERVTSKDPLPPAKYAVDLASNTVVYSEICLSPDLCFSWQRWPVEAKGQ